MLLVLPEFIHLKHGKKIEEKMSAGQGMCKNIILHPFNFFFLAFNNTKLILRGSSIGLALSMLSKKMSGGQGMCKNIILHPFHFFFLAFNNTKLILRGSLIGLALGMFSDDH